MTRYNIVLEYGNEKLDIQRIIDNVFANYVQQELAKSPSTMLPYEQDRFAGKEAV